MGKVFRITQGLVLSIIMMTTLVQAQTSQYGNVKFDIPKGWRSLDQGQLVLLLPPDITKQEKFFIVMTPGQELRGDFRTTFDTVLQGALAANERLVQAGEVKLDHAPEGFDRLSKPLVVENLDGSNRTIRVYSAANPGGRFEMIVMIATDEALFEKYRSSYKAFLNSCKFANIAYSSGSPASNKGSPASSENYGSRSNIPETGKRCRIVQRQMCSGGIGTSLGYFCNTYPQQVCD